MHENIKYTIALSDKIKPYEPARNFPKPIDEKNSKADWQCVFGGIDYGTHYFVYAKFIGQRTVGGFQVKNLQLYLQNYTGAVTIGIVGEMKVSPYSFAPGDTDPDNDQIRYPNRKRYTITVRLKGFHGNEFVEDTSVNFEVKHGDILQVNPEFVPIDNALTKIQESRHNMQHALYVDDKFMVRQGDDVDITPAGLEEIRDLGLHDVVSTFDEYDSQYTAFSRPLGRLHPCKPINSIFFV